MYCDLHAQGKRLNGLVHRMVAKTFIKNNEPERLKYVNHIDFNKLNNNVNNLEWCTMSENHVHRVKKQKELDRD